MVDFKMFLKTLSSPSLYMVHRAVWEKYNPNDWEKMGDTFLHSIFLFCKFWIYTSPLVVTYMYRRGYLTSDNFFSFSKIGVGLGLIMGTSLCIRSYGRSTNEKYREFISKLESLSESEVKSAIKEIKRYDFDFAAWPVEYEFQESMQRKTYNESAPSWRSSITSIIQSPCSLLGYMVLHTFGIRMIYPGSTTLLNYFLSATLMDGRRALIETSRGERFKLKTIEGNFIDSMFVDKRGNRSEKSQVLVVCSEGNAGFYENGIMPTAIEAGYSVLGWNHPGFGCSTGMPYPEQEKNAVDTVMQFAILKLGFQPENIILYGWSIGGYSSAWAALQYPEVKSLVLDATFDDILPLALNQMPEFLESLVRLTIRSYADLNVARYLVEYTGPIKLVRRTEDEIICIQPGRISTNRGNFLLKKLLKRRYPALMTNASEAVLQDWFETTGSSRDAIMVHHEVDRSICKALIEDYVSRHGNTLPYQNLGKESNEQLQIALILYLAETYMVDYRSTHCTPLPSSLFQNVTDS